MDYVNVIERDTKHMVSYNLGTRLFQDNIIKIDEEITPELANDVINQLLYLKAKLKDETTPDKKTIKIYINSPGGSVYDGLGIYDMMQLLNKEGYIIETVNTGLAASMGSLLLMAGTKGHRKSLPHAHVMVHELSSVSYGKSSTMVDDIKQLEKIQSELNEITKKHASEELITLCTRKDFWMNAEESKTYRIIDSIIYTD